MAGTLTVTQPWTCIRKDIYFCQLDWTDDTAGIAAAEIPATKHVIGKWITAAVSKPSAVTAPTDDYDITIRNPAFGNIDVFQGGTIDRDEATAEATMYNSAPIPMTNAGLTFTLENNSVNGALGTVWLFASSN